jgi:hypothetical protein
MISSFLLQKKRYDTKGIITEARVIYSNVAAIII